MCILIGKWFPDTGWVGVKNRDRNYIPKISFKKINKQDTEILYFWDDITRYCEGFNSHGVSILSASLMVLDDEKEIDKRSDRPSPDGQKIKRALENATVKGAVQSLIKQKLPGNTMIWDTNNMCVLEGAWKPGEYAQRNYTYRVRFLPRTETVARTNHGVWLPWAGYQRDKGPAEAMSRVSSESRLAIAKWIAQEAHSPEQLLDLLTADYAHNGQLNALRTSNDNKKMRTTSQIMIVPKERTMYVRPVQSHIHYNFWDMNHPEQRTWVELLSNRVLYQNVRAGDRDKPLIFKSSLEHNSL